MCKCKMLRAPGVGGRGGRGPRPCYPQPRRGAPCAPGAGCRSWGLFAAPAPPDPVDPLVPRGRWCQECSCFSSPRWGGFLPVKKRENWDRFGWAVPGCQPRRGCSGHTEEQGASCLAVMPGAQPPTAPQCLGPHSHHHWGPRRSPKVLCRWGMQVLHPPSPLCLRCAGTAQPPWHFPPLVPFFQLTALPRRLLLSPFF